MIGKLDQDLVCRSEFAYITRNKETIDVPPGHPLYSKAKEEEERFKQPSITDDVELERFAAQFQDELDEEIFGSIDDESNISIQQQILDEANKNLEKTKKKKVTKKARANVRHVKSNLTVEDQDSEIKKTPILNSHPPSIPKQDENLFNLEELKAEPIELDLSNMFFPKIYVTKEDELTDSLRPKRSK